MKLYHLSHIDLDGYSCQYITKQYFKDAKYYNSNYGDEIDEKLRQIFRDIEKNMYEDNLVLITDVNLTGAQANRVEDLKSNSSKRVEILLLDHHQSGEAQANLFDWYHLDITKCATKITYEYFGKILGEKPELKHFVDIVNSIDIWLDYEDTFELGKVLLKLLADSNEINRIMFPADNNKYMFKLLDAVQSYFEKADAHIVLDESIHKIKKQIFNSAKNDTLDNLIASYIVDLLSLQANKLEVVYKGQKGVFTYSLRGVSVIGNMFLKHNPQYDFFMNLSGGKNISFRANDKLDVSKLASDVFGGGGHKNASGARYKEFKDSFIYQKMRTQINEVFSKF
ncbi:MAG: 3'-to-5' oligoribonuclease B, Bacillus type [uncultured Campylobacterales bacterium]|uniref:3'-to-5' oligoribonuclease B, Bacillus type n=1 Tax=uncultured Campylobacterales bacterium TaxID=352960 RepID=A0A6S6S7Q3_9BACT|nr:MAG: 3'-to-5' oligoribonuclease B, Bacillus type [uncultured Campylobacterales bacterium]